MISVMSCVCSELQIGCVSLQVGRHGKCGAYVAGVTNQSYQHEHVQQSEPLSAGLPDGGTSPTHSVGEMHKYLGIQRNLEEIKFLRIVSYHIYNL